MEADESCHTQSEAPVSASTSLLRAVLCRRGPRPLLLDSAEAAHCTQASSACAPRQEGHPLRAGSQSVIIAAHIAQSPALSRLRL